MENLICDICHKKTKELYGFNYSEIKMCNKCYILHLENQCENLRSCILNNFNEQDRKRFLKECCKGKLFDDVLKTFKPNTNITKLEQELAELKEKYTNCDNERLENRMDYLNMKNEWLNVNKQLAELEEKAIVPPVKVGQDIYIIYNEKIERRVVSKISIVKKGVNINAVLYKKYGACWCNRKFSTLDKTWWLTEQEAQEARRIKING